MEKSGRNYGIDLLRILSMYMIVILHVLAQGGVMVRISSHPETYYASWVLETAAFCAVNCYGLISGYVGLQSRFRPARILELWLQVFFWSAGIALVFLFVRPAVFAEVEVPDLFGIFGRSGYLILRYLLPVQFKTYWYFSAYFALFFLTPFLNRMVRSLRPGEAKALLGVLFLVFSLGTMIAKAFSLDFLQLAGGYTLIWLLVLYLMGACLRIIDVRMNRKRKIQCVCLYLGMVFLAWIYKIGMENHTRTKLGKAMYGRLFTTYTAPTILLCGISLLLLCKDLRLEASWVKKGITLLSPVSFSVYLIHTHPLIWEHVLKNAFRSYRSMKPVPVFFAVLGTALGIYCLCSALAYGQWLLFRMLPVHAFCESLADGGRKLFKKVLRID